MKDKVLISGAVLMMFGVILGAFGAHGMNDILIDNNKLDTYETATKYLFYHSIGILILGLVYKDNKFQGYCFYTMLVGIVIFSGSLYLLSITNISIFGLFTPVGGLLLIASWVLFILGIKKG